MDEKMLIEAMRQMMREEIGREVGKALEPINGRLDKMDAHMSSMEDDMRALKADNAEIREDLQSVKADLSDVKQRVTKIEVTQEQVTNKNIGLLMDAQVETRDKVKKLDKVAEDVEEIKVRVAALESVTKENTSQIKDIRLAK